MKNGLNSQKWSTVRRKLFETFLEIQFLIWLKDNLKVQGFNYLWLTIRENIMNKLWKMLWKMLWSVILKHVIEYIKQLKALNF